MMDFAKLFNLAEAALWLVIGIVFFAKAWRTRSQPRRIHALLGAAFLVFSVSDVIESQTGAWWQPPWLLGMKAACVATLVWGFRALYRLKGK